jgi:dolichol kinase
MFINIIIILGLYSIVILFAEVLYVYGVNPFFTRKVAHMCCGIVSAFLPRFLELNFVLIVAAFVFLVAFITKYFLVFKGVEAADKKSFGTMMFALGIATTAALFWETSSTIFSGAMLVLGFADSFAALIGKNYGKRKYKIFDMKSFEGSFVFFVVTIFITVSVYYFHFAGFQSFGGLKLCITIIGAFILTMIEGLSSRGLDNIFVSTGAGMILYLLFTV